MGLSPPSAIRGFTLIEVLIAFIILSFGLLGAVALQAKAKQASFDAMQRAAAVALGNDILQRIRANDTIASIGLYGKENIDSSGALATTKACFGSSCNSLAIAYMDIVQWKRAIQARENTGSLDDATVCINPEVVAGTGGKGFNLEVIVTWQGRQELSANKGTESVSCGIADKRRRLVVMNSYIYVRS